MLYRTKDTLINIFIHKNNTREPSLSFYASLSKLLLSMLRKAYPNLLDKALAQLTGYV